MPSNLPEIHKGIKAVFDSIPELAEVVPFFPAYGAHRMLFYAFAGGKKLDWPIEAVVYEWSWAGRFMVEMTNAEEGEAELLELVPIIMEASETHLDAFETIDEGTLQIDIGTAGFATIGSAEFRVCNFTITVIETFPQERALH